MYIPIDYPLKTIIFHVIPSGFELYIQGILKLSAGSDGDGDEDGGGGG